MRRFIATVLTIALYWAGPPAIADGGGSDPVLKSIIASKNIRPLPARPFKTTRKFQLGQALFFDPVLSGNRDVSCATCHLLGRGTSDGLTLSIGVGGVGLGEDRTPNPVSGMLPRNSLSLWDRVTPSVTSIFWDGRVERLDPKKRVFRSPLGNLLPDGLENVVAIQALFPFTGVNEMLGRPGDRSARTLPPAHADSPNELADNAKGLTGPPLMSNVHRSIMDRLLGLKGGGPKAWQIEYRRLFKLAYPDTSVDFLSIVDLANAIAEFEAIAFTTGNTAWDRYVGGDTDALSTAAKTGAVVFFGKGKCAICHSGPLFSDFKFHSIGVRQAGPGKNSKGEDLGRYLVTKNSKDKYKFRTPPLRNVTLSGPYFHDGVARTLKEAVAQHLAPLRSIVEADHIASVSPLLKAGIALSEREIAALLDFLKALEAPQTDLQERIIPKSVPSGLAVSAVAGK